MSYDAYSVMNFRHHLLRPKAQAALRPATELLAEAQILLNLRPACASGLVALASDDADAATTSATRGCQLWREVEAPHETARARVVLGRALRAAGDLAGCELELRAALAAFERLDAVLDRDRAGRLVAEVLPTG